jgi:hypothetical protein
MAPTLSVQDLLSPLTKKVSRVPVSRQNWANAATTGLLAPSSTVRANWLPSPGSRVSTPTGGATLVRGIIGDARAAGPLVTTAMVPTAMAANTVRLSTHATT